MKFKPWLSAARFTARSDTGRQINDEEKTNKISEPAEIKINYQPYLYLFV